MKRPNERLLPPLCALLLSACNGAGGGHAAPPATDLSPGDDATTDASVGDDATTTVDASAPLDARGAVDASGSVDVSAEASDVAVAEVAPIPPPLCAKSYSMLTATPVDVPASSDDALLAAMTWDERTLAWVTTTAGVTAVHYADRASPSDAFLTVMDLPDSLGPYAPEKVALGADGLTLLFPTADHKSIVQVRRPSRGASFDPSTATTAPFAAIVAAPKESPTAPMPADLVLSEDGTSLYFTDLSLTSGVTIRVSRLAPDRTWGAGARITGAELDITMGQRRRPTGLSSDGRTLFIYDEFTASPALMFGPPGGLDFPERYTFVPTGPNAMPNADCSRVYLSVLRATAKGADPVLVLAHSP